MYLVIYFGIVKISYYIIVENLDYQIPVTQLNGPKRTGNRQSTKRDWNAPPTRDLNIWLEWAAETKELRKKLRNLHAKSR